MIQYFGHGVLHGDLHFFQLSFPQHTVSGIEPEPFVLVQPAGDIHTVFPFQYGVDSLDNTERFRIFLYAFLIKAAWPFISSPTAPRTDVYTAESSSAERSPATTQVFSSNSLAAFRSSRTLAMASVRDDLNAANELLLNTCVVAGDRSALEDSAVYTSVLGAVGELIKGQAAFIRKA